MKFIIQMFIIHEKEMRYKGNCKFFISKLSPWIFSSNISVAIHLLKIFYEQSISPFPVFLQGINIFEKLPFIQVRNRRQFFHHHFQVFSTFFLNLFCRKRVNFIRGSNIISLRVCLRAKRTNSRSYIKNLLIFKIYITEFKHSIVFIKCPTNKNYIL